MNNQTLENYVVERVKKLENEVSILKDECIALTRDLNYVNEMKAKMREYFKLNNYATGKIYIDRTYDDKYIDEIIQFIGFEEKTEPPKEG